VRAWPGENRPRVEWCKCVGRRHVGLFLDADAIKKTVSRPR
jgi:hypothetical protein